MLIDKIKFPPAITPSFISELRENVKQYFEAEHISRFGNLNMVLKTIFMVTVYILPFLLMITGIVSSVPLIFVCWLIMGLGMAGVGMALMHDANHGTYTKNRTLNTFLSQSLYLLGGFPATWQYQHNTLHHGFTNVDGHDDDINPIWLLRISPHKPLQRIHKFQYLYASFLYGLMTLSWTITKDFQQIYKYKKMGAEFGKSNSLFRVYTRLVISKVLYYFVFLILPLLLIQAPWYWIVLSYLGMHFTAGLILSTIFQTAHVVPTSKYPIPDVNGNMENNWAIHQLQTTCNFSPKSKMLSWLIGGLNYQVEHHLFPNICHVHYKSISQIVQKTALKYNLPYSVNPNFIVAIHNHTKMLKMLGR